MSTAGYYTKYRPAMETLKGWKEMWWVAGNMRASRYGVKM